MKKCEECGTTLGIFKGYHHPTMGKGHLLCSKCFDDVNESVTLWQEFVLSNAFKNVASEKTLFLSRKIFPIYLYQQKKKIDNVIIKNKM
jgi:hypothetical protein